MAQKAYPYISSVGSIGAAITQFRKSFPSRVNAETLQKLAIAPYNESYLINILRFLGVIDDEGKRTVKAEEVFSKHEDADFNKAFAALIKSGYRDLFELHKDATWTLPTGSLIAFFRTTDKSSDLVGKRQAATFQTLASFAGYGDAPSPVKSGRDKQPKAKKAKLKADIPAPAAAPSNGSATQSASRGTRDIGMTVRIEVNLPAAADQQTYDRIFRSIRENLLNAK